VSDFKSIMYARNQLVYYDMPT